MPTHNIVSMSGGKDSTATLLVARELEVPNLSTVVADTGHEHPERRTTTSTTWPKPLEFPSAPTG